MRLFCCVGLAMLSWCQDQAPIDPPCSTMKNCSHFCLDKHSKTGAIWCCPYPCGKQGNGDLAPPCYHCSGPTPVPGPSPPSPKPTPHPSSPTPPPSPKPTPPPTPVPVPTPITPTPKPGHLNPPALNRLPAGAIKPLGWLNAEARLMTTGLTGSLPDWAGGFKNTEWIGETTDTRGDEQGGEYYMNGMIPLSCQIDTPKLRHLREVSVHKILHGQNKNKDGMFGDEIPHGDVNNKISYWGRMDVVLALESYVECEGEFAPNATMKQAVEAALVSNAKGFYKRASANDPPFWHNPYGSARYVEVLIGAQWLIDRGHTDPELWSLMELAGRSSTYTNWIDWFAHGDPFTDHQDKWIKNCWGNKSDPAMRNFMIHHGVNNMEAIKTGPVWWRVSGNATSLGNSAAALAFIDKWVRSADGTFTAPDCVASGSGPHTPSTGVETCSVVEEMFSLRTAYEITGDIALFDRLEFVAFNAMPATTMSDFSGNAYYHSVNQVEMAGKTGFGINGCCTGNVHQGWPKFIMAGVQTTGNENGNGNRNGNGNGNGPESGNGNGTIVVSGYSPSVATLPDGTTVTIAGQYPFADSVTITISRAPATGTGTGMGMGMRMGMGTNKLRDVDMNTGLGDSTPPAAKAWALKLRIPCWVDSALVTVNTAAAAAAAGAAAAGGAAGAAGVAAAPCAYYDVAGGLSTSTATLVIKIAFGNSIKVLSNKWKGGAVEVRRGPLLFTYPIPGNIGTVPTGGYNGTMVKTTTIRPVHPYNKSDGARVLPWQVALHLDDPDNQSASLAFDGFRALDGYIPFSPSKPGCLIKGQARVVKGYRNDNLPGSPVPATDFNSSVFDIELVPLAQSHLRLTVLPVCAS